MLFSFSRIRFNFWFDVEIRNHINITENAHVFLSSVHRRMLTSFLWSTYKFSRIFVVSLPFSSHFFSRHFRIQLKLHHPSSSLSCYLDFSLCPSLFLSVYLTYFVWIYFVFILLLLLFEVRLQTFSHNFPLCCGFFAPNIILEVVYSVVIKIMLWSVYRLIFLFLFMCFCVRRIQFTNFFTFLRVLWFFLVFF